MRAGQGWAMLIRPEAPGEEDAIRALTALAFEGAAFSDGTEAAIVDALRIEGALTVSVVAVDGGRIIGHAAFSPVTIDDAPAGWWGLGPLSVHPDRQGRGVGAALVRAGLERLAELNAAGCVVLGTPGYYGRFGFAHDPALTYAAAPAPYFQRLVLAGPPARGEARYRPAFGG
jgi:predicted N-acetyltransferase YhbS